MSSESTGAQWVFDPIPPSGARRGGDPAEHAFHPTLESFVREVIQNANDQRIDSVEIGFNLHLLEGDALRRFLTALEWSILRRHLWAATESPRGETIRQTVEEFERTDRLLLLNVTDYGTTGLTGDEWGDNSNFSALCKDILYSHKERGSSAGGSFGLGKSVLWRFSGFSTVVFSSHLQAGPNADASPRLIGRAELPSHYVQEEDTHHEGSGWFGCARRTEHGERAESLWGAEGQQLAHALYLDREPPSGTSILIVGFREPAEETEPELGNLQSRIRKSAAINFWPALSRQKAKLDVGVAHNGGHLNYVKTSDEQLVAPFVGCLAHADQAKETLEEVGDVARREVRFEIPQPRNGASGLTEVRATLLVRLADERETGDLRDHVAMFRGPGMIVQYWPRTRLAIGARPFHAILLCGEAHAQPDEQDRALERFLRAAEPPGHDRWEVTVGLKEQYRRGYKKALDQMRQKIDDQLKDLVVAQPAKGERGPDLLSRRFPLEPQRKQPPGSSRSKSPFSFSGLYAFREDGYWKFGGTVGPSVSNHSGWTAEITARLITEDGDTAEHVRLSRLTKGEGVDWDVDDGKLVIHADAETGETHIEGCSESNPDPARTEGELELTVQGRVREEQDT